VAKQTSLVEETLVPFHVKSWRFVWW
jgi:hypothetical protein